ncbi:MAG: phosphotransferase enzyme family protein [Christensenellales bacterium]|jgi:hypothetical protein|nr:phosphotransferase [Clostridiales bacterium]
MNPLLSVVSQFKIEGKPFFAEPYGHGHINRTYLVKCQTEKGEIKYILQQINHNVFKNVKNLMENIVAVTNQIVKKMTDFGEDTTEALKVIKTKEGKAFLQDKGESYKLLNSGNYPGFNCIKGDDGHFYRLYNFIKSGISIETKATAKQFRSSALGFAKFQKYLDGFDASVLHESIPNFHNTVIRFKNFEKAICEDVANRAKDVKDDIEKYKSRKKYANRVVDLLESGKIPTRVTHNDTKLNNVLINLETLDPIAVIDLDTVMPGSLLYDFGDSIRSGATTGAEDEKDLSKVNFSIELFEAYVDGFMSQLANRLTDKEIELLAFSAILMTYECGLRFLTDHLQNDIYFRVHRENHNIDRARTQMKLVEDMEKVLPTMNEIVYKYKKLYSK